MTENPQDGRRLKAWQEAIDSLMQQIQEWCEGRQWLVKRDAKTVREESTGEYEVPVLTVQAGGRRIIIDPVALYVVGGGGRVDIFAWPSLEKVLLVDFESGWRLVSTDKVPFEKAWSEDTFFEIADSLMAVA